MTRLGRTLALSLALASPSAAALAAPPEVVVTIKPLYGLAAAVMQGVGEPYLLLDGTASPHGYSLRPSEAGRIDEADLVVWVGPALESFLVEPLHSLAEDARLVTAMELPGLTLLAAREGGIWAPHHHHDGDHEHEEAGEHHDEHDEDHHADGDDDHDEEQHAETDHDDHDDHEHGEVDPHVWLDPHNAEIIATALAAALSEEDPQNAERYAGNLSELKKALEALDRQTTAQLAPIQAQPFIVFHDAYAYFEARYGLSPAGSITVSPEQRPGARRIAEIRDVIQNRGAVCIFAEPQFSPALIESVTEGSEVRSGTLDPLGASLPKGPTVYQETLEDLTQSLVGCLSVSG